jgi:hypothetical protein
VPERDPRARMRAFQATRAATLRRLRRVNQVLSRWDEYEAAQAMPPELRPRVRRPTLSSGALNELSAMLHGVIDDQEARWERRH